MKKQRIIQTYGGYFEDFMSHLTVKEQEKVKYGLLLLSAQGRMSVKFVKFIRNGLFELRTEYNGNIYRVFFTFDNDNIVILYNSFQKKTRKTPVSEIEKAERIKEEYYARKQSSTGKL